jgi:hypothetical protein
MGNEFSHPAGGEEPRAGARSFFYGKSRFHFGG